MKKTTGIALLLLLSLTTSGQHIIKKLKITILSTMLADQGRGEWGFSALIEADSLRILFDSGTHPTMVMDNAKDLGINLDGIHRVILSHSHDDHTGGWRSLRDHYKNSFEVTTVGEGFFIPRVRSTPSTNGTRNSYDFTLDSLWYVKGGGRFNVLSDFTELYPGIYLTGPVPRKYPEKNYTKGWLLKTNGSLKEDNIPEDISLVIATSSGLVLVSGCGHAGIVNTMDYATLKTGKKKIVAAIGGFHLLDADDKQIAWTSGELKKRALNIL